MNALVMRAWLVVGLLGTATWLAFAGLDRAVAVPDPGDPGRGRLEWPIFGGNASRNMANPFALNLPTEWDDDQKTPRNILWSARLPDYAYGSPVVSGDRVYLGCNNHHPLDPNVKGPRATVLCFATNTGKLLWQRTHNIESPHLHVRGFCSTPTVEGDRVYYVTPSCQVMCVNTNGMEVWGLDLAKELNVAPLYTADYCPHPPSPSSPLVVGDRLFACTGTGVDCDGQLPKPAPSSFVAIERRTGRVLWHSNLGSDATVEGQCGNAAYAEIDGKGQVIFPGGDGWLYGLEPATGKLIWKFNCNPAATDKRRPHEPRAHVTGTPVVVGHHVFVGIGTYPSHPNPSHQSGHLWCIDIRGTGDLSARDDRLDPTSPLNKGSGLVWHHGGPPLPEQNQKRHNAFGVTGGTVAVQDGLLYATDRNGYAYCLDARTGRLQWDHDLMAEILGSPLWADGKTYVGADDGDVTIFAHGKQKKLIRKVEMQDPLRGTPVAVGRTLYLTAGERLLAIGVK